MTLPLRAEATEESADVLVIGGGPAGAWAALSAAEAGLRVILVDKGYFGTSGATAPSNTGTWCVAPGHREAEIQRRMKLTGEMADEDVIGRTLDGAWQGLHQLLRWGYPFPKDQQGQPYIANLRGPDYMRFMRQKARQAGVIIYDHSPALALLQDSEGVAGAAGIHRQKNRFWRITATAVILATGGCAFGERFLGAAGLTGDGYLLGAQAGAVLSGMEYSAQYGITPRHTSMNKGIIYQWATFYDREEKPLIVTGDRQSALAQALLNGPVYARLDRADPALQRLLRQSQPNCFVPFDRQGINPFSDRFEIILRNEGTVRGLGGLRLIAATGATDVPGLYAAGDAASREQMNGAISGGGGPNASWAIASGRAAGQAAALLAQRQRHSLARRQQQHRRTALWDLGGIGADLQISRRAEGPDAETILRAVREEMLPLEKNFFRSAEGMTHSMTRLYQLYKTLSLHGYGEADRQMPGLLQRREARALLSVARWTYKAALLRQESRGIHRRLDQPTLNPALNRHILLKSTGRAAWDRPLSLSESL
ncbi:FAD-binding protein [Paramixta manurensis]|uniref:FAD-binding protein n=1 Tax=Paramixta manurensis TaxID=2740817 RepID=A0A6M8UGT0_9GAMM|nr:FAD-binding protein [Erwiniaceae bacterium PD-1]